MAITATVTSFVDLVAVAAAHNGFGSLSTYGMECQRSCRCKAALALVGLAVYAVSLNREQRRARDLELAAANGLLTSLLANSDAMISVREYDACGDARYVLAQPAIRTGTRSGVDQIVGKTQDSWSRIHEPPKMSAQRTRRARVEPFPSLVTRTVSGATDDSAAGPDGSRVTW